MQGVLPDAPRLAVVGSRAALTLDRPGVARLVKLAGAAGWSLVSGGALGVDGWMHQAALDQGLAQLAVLPCALGTFYPPAHAALFRDIALSGHSGVLYSMDPAQEPARHVFIARNEIVLRCCSALVVVQSRPRSGSLWTAKRALALKIPTAVFSGSVGADRLIAGGAVDLGCSRRPKFDQAVQRFLAGKPLKRSKPWPSHLAHLQGVFESSPGAPLGVEAFPDPLLAAAQLVEAATLGLVVELGPGQYRALVL